MSDTCDFLDAAYWMISKDDISKIYLSRVIVTLAFRAAPCDDFDDLASTRRRRRLGAYCLAIAYIRSVLAAYAMGYLDNLYFLFNI